MVAWAGLSEPSVTRGFIARHRRRRSHYQRRTSYYNRAWVIIILISILMYSKLDFISHSNSIHQPMYRFLLIPATFAGFFMLIVLIFQQPFVTTHIVRELLVYFRICSWLLAVSMFFYVLDAFRRTYVKS